MAVTGGLGGLQRAPDRWHDNTRQLAVTTRLDRVAQYSRAARQAISWHFAHLLQARKTPYFVAFLILSLAEIGGEHGGPFTFRRMKTEDHYVAFLPPPSRDVPLPPRMFWQVPPISPVAFDPDDQRLLEKTAAQHKDDDC